MAHRPAAAIAKPPFVLLLTVAVLLPSAVASGSDTSRLVVSPPTAGHILTWSEQRTQAGASFDETTVVYLATGVARVEVTRVGDDQPYMTATYRADTRQMHVFDRRTPSSFVVTREWLERAGAGAAPARRELTALDETAEASGIACRRYRLEDGSATSELYLAARSEVELSGAELRALREMMSLFLDFKRVDARRSQGVAPAEWESNAYDLAEGFPVVVTVQTASETRHTELKEIKRRLLPSELFAHTPAPFL